MKKIIICLMAIGLILGITKLHAQWVNDSDFYYDSPTQSTTTIDTLSSEEKTSLWEIVKNNTVSDSNNEVIEDSILYKIRQFFRLTDTDTYDSQTPATDYVKMLINIALGFVSFIALIMIIFAFYLIFFGKWEENVAKAKKILIGVAIAIFVIWLSWIIVSSLFGLLREQTTWV
jgi:hypothetical protein